MKEQHKKQVTDVFCKSIQKDFQTYCNRHSLDQNFNTFVTYAIDFNFIPDTTIQHYAILKTFEDLGEEKQLKKTEKVDKLANRFNLTTRSIWNVLRKKSSQ